MPEKDNEQSGANWPLVKFAFNVKIGDHEMMFEEVSGLNSETQIIKYRSGDSKVFSTVKMPGIKKFSNIRFKKGIFKGDKAFWDFYNSVKMNTMERQTVMINLLDEQNAVAMSWSLTNAFPVKITVTDMKADANEVAIETIEMAHEGLEILNK